MKAALAALALSALAALSCVSGSRSSPARPYWSGGVLLGTRHPGALVLGSDFANPNRRRNVHPWPQRLRREFAGAAAAL